MCEMCDGKSFHQVLDDTRDHVRRFGWAVRGVQAEEGRPGWVITVGLLDSYEHPELVVFDDDWFRGASLLNALGRAVRDGEELVPGDHLGLGPGAAAHVVDVHPDHLGTEVFAMWHNVRRVGTVTPPDELLAHQVVLLHPEAGQQGPDGIRLDRPAPPAPQAPQVPPWEWPRLRAG
jgi:hypothetical protein